VNNLEIDQHLLAPSNQPTNSPSVFQTLIFHQLFSVTRNECDKVAGDLRNAGIQAIAYHAGLSDSQRSRIQEDWIRDRCKVFISICIVLKLAIQYLVYYFVFLNRQIHLKRLLTV
jgi:hypothetical protein